MYEQNLARAGRYTVLAIMCVLTLLPLIGMLLIALQPSGTIPNGITWPDRLHFENFVLAWQAADFLPLLWSSTLIVLGVVPVSVLLSIIAGYSIGILRPVGGKIVSAIFLIGLALPFEALITPLYYQIRDLGLLGSRWALIIPLIGLNMAFGVYWMRTHFASLPSELNEAASIDGASSIQKFMRIHLPLSSNSISALVILFFLWTWNQFLLALVLIDDPSKRTMAGGLGAFSGQYSTDVVLLSAGALEIMLPSLLVFVLLQRRFVGALMAGAIK